MTESSPAKNKLERPDRSVGMYAEVYSGALPHPKHLAEYDEIVPGYAKKILDKAMEQTDHRIEIEKRVITSNIGNEKLGMCFAFITAMTVTIGGFVLIYSNKTIPGGLFAMLTPFFGLGITFYFKKRAESKELKKKKREIEPIITKQIDKQ